MAEHLEMTADKFTFQVASDRRYTPQGVWVLEETGTRRVRVGLADYIQQRNGDIAFANVKPPGTKLQTGEPFAEIETIKAMVELASPASGTIIQVNAALETTPEVINQTPYENGWLTVIETASWETDRPKLLDASAYFKVMEAQVQEELKNL
jgi:glycine cleavage system H protein